VKENEMQKSLGAEPGNLSDLARYEVGSIVSNTIHKDAAGTIIAFAFDAGEELSEHTAPFEAFIQVLDGEAEVSVGGKPQAVGPGQLIRLPAGVPHAVRAPKRFKMLLTMMRAPAATA
jgi:quercetin dioxygenase-like cupin family protein